MATTAILLIPLLVFTAFAVDVGGWYYQATRQQQAADAAALAAVVWMPDIAKATAAAKDIATANGFPAFEQQVNGSGQPVFDGSGNPVYDLTKPYATVTVEAVNSQAVRVKIVAAGEVYFGSVVLTDDVNIDRRSVAEYIRPVSMGNPSSALGTGDLANPAGVQNLWLAVNSYCAGRQQGDQYSSRYLTPSWFCPGGPYSNKRWNGGCGFTPANLANLGCYSTENRSEGTRAFNPQYSAEGYYLAVDMPPGSEAWPWRLEAYDPGICDFRQESHSYHPDLASNTQKGTRLDMTLYGADDTPTSDIDNVDPANVFGHVLFGINDCGWQTLGTINPTDQRGRWIINYKSRAVTYEEGMNYFAVRAVPTSGSNAGQTCLTTTSTWCPSVSAIDRFPVYAPSKNAAGNSVVTPGNPATFYLAQIGEEHAGKTLLLDLFDPGEGMANLQIIAPAPTFIRYPFTWSSTDCSTLGVCVANGSSGTITLTDISGNSWSPRCHIGSTDAVTAVTGNYDCLNVTNDRLQGRTANIRLDIPADYRCGTDCWWRIRYEPQGSVTSVTDRTTWSIRIVGDPVRLVD